MIKRYDSIAALRAHYIALGGRANNWHSDNSWYGYETEQETLLKSELGDTSLVPAAENLLSELETQIETPRKVWERAPAGAFCIVPDVLAGLPTPMRRQAQTRDETSPITILAITTSSAGISADILAKRGTTILALVLALARIRPVTLQQLTILDGRDEGETILTAEINTHPLDLATACYVLTSAGFARRLTYGIGERINAFGGGWPRSFNYYSPQCYYDKLIPKLVPDPTRCLVIGAAQFGDQLLENPIAWLNAQIARFASATADAED